MPQEFQVLQCYQCATFQVQQVKKAKKWQCKICGEKQSIKKVFGRGSGAECRHHVQKLNTLRGELDVQADSIICSSVLSTAANDGNHGNMPPEVVEEEHDNASNKWSKYKIQDQNEGRDEASEEMSHLGVNYTTDMKEFKSALKESRKSYKRKRANRDDYVSRSNTTPGGQQSAVSCSSDASEFSIDYQESFAGFQNLHNNVQPPEESSYTYGFPSVSQGTKKICQNNRFSVTNSCGSKFSETNASKYKDVSDDTIGSDKSHDIVGEEFRYRQRVTNRKTTASQGGSKWGKFMEDDENKSNDDDDENFTSDWVCTGQSSTFNPEIFEGREPNVRSYRKEKSNDISPGSSQQISSGSSQQISPGSSQQILSERILHQVTCLSNMNQDSGLDEHLTNNQTRHGGQTSWSAESLNTEHEAVSQNENQLRCQDTPWTVAMETRRQNRTVPYLENPSGVDSISSSGMRVKEKQNKIAFKENFPSSIPLVRSVTGVNNSKALFIVDDLNDDDFSLDL